MIQAVRASSIRRRGYVLLLVLFVLALAAAALAQVSRLSFEKAVIASHAEEDLRQRWALISCRSVLLPKAKALIARVEAPARGFRREISLNGQNFTLVFGDEQAKANVNLLYAQAGLAEAERQVRVIAAASGGGGTPIELHSIPGLGKSFGPVDATNNANPPGDDQQPAFESFGQVFSRIPPQTLLAESGKLPSIASMLTCWGDGSMNLSRASTPAAKAVLSRYLSAAETSKLLNFEAKNPGIQSSDALDSLNLSDARRGPLDNLLIDESNCYSMWLISHPGGRIRYDLSVSQGSGDLVTFSW